MASSKRPRPRRSHVLGGCSTCRHRHVKCDQKRPVCRTCRALGVPCEGYSDQVLWMRSGDDEEELQGARRGTRRHLYTGKGLRAGLMPSSLIYVLEKSRLSMSTALGSDLVSGSIDASLAEVDSRLRDPERCAEGDIVIGPFAVLDFSSAPQKPAQEVTELHPQVGHNDHPITSTIAAPDTLAPRMCKILVPHQSSTLCLISTTSFIGPTC